MQKKVKGIAWLLGLVLVGLISGGANLALFIPGVGVGVFIGSTYFSVAALACGAAGPAGWFLLGMITSWGL